MSVPTAAPQLPAHLMNFGNATSLGLNAVGGINVGKSPPRISIKQNRFRTVDAQGQEFMIPALYLDVIIVGANPVVSKTYYAGAYDPSAADAVAPTCWSDNGVGPSSRAQSPQSPTCANCQFNVWGSKVTPAGSKIKACSDTKKLAVVLADNPGGEVYQLRVPGASLENLKAICDMLIERNVVLPALVIRMTFDETAGYPKLLFNAASYISEAQKAAVLEVLDGEEVKEAVGLGDVPVSAGVAIAPPAPAPLPIQQPTVLPPLPPAPQQFTPPAPMPPQYQQAAPPPPTFMQSPPATAPVMQPPAAPVRRRRRTQAEMQADNPQQGTTMAAPPPQFAPIAQPPAPPAAVGTGFEIPPFLKRQDVANAAPPAASVPMQPQQTDAALDAMLAGAMQK